MATAFYLKNLKKTNFERLKLLTQNKTPLKTSKELSDERNRTA